MKLTTYLYTGPQSAASLRLGETGQLFDVQLFPGQPVGLPANHDYTLVLLALNHLHSVPPSTKSAGKTSVSDKE